MPPFSIFSATAFVALGSGQWILVGVVVVTLVAAAFALFSRTGSGIATHPQGSTRGDVSGSADDELDSDGELPGSEGQRFPSTRGTR